MPAEVCRTSPARSISRCEAICASAGVSFSVGMKPWDRRIGFDPCGYGRRDPSLARQAPPDAAGQRCPTEFLCGAQEE